MSSRSRKKPEPEKKKGLPGWAWALIIGGIILVIIIIIVVIILLTSGGDNGGNGGCSSDANCAGTTPKCNTSTGICQECLASPDCPTGQTCVGGQCQLTCITNNDCTAPNECIDGICQLPPAMCINDGDCSGATPKCDIGTNTCVECLTDGDCSGIQVCSNNVCGGCVLPSPPTSILTFPGYSTPVDLVFQLTYTEDSSPTLSGHKIYLSKIPAITTGNAQFIIEDNTTGDGSTTITDSDLGSIDFFTGETWFVRVSSVDDCGEGDLSPETSGTFVCGNLGTPNIPVAPFLFSGAGGSVIISHASGGGLGSTNQFLVYASSVMNFDPNNASVASSNNFPSSIIQNNAFVPPINPIATSTWYFKIQEVGTTCTSVLSLESFAVALGI